MTTDQPTPPTSDAIDAVARTMTGGGEPCEGAFNDAECVLTSKRPEVHAALAASLPDDVMLAELVKRGTLHEEPWSARCSCGARMTEEPPEVVEGWSREHDDSPDCQHVVSWEPHRRIRPWQRRHVTPWEVAP
jgi:hypothetical protein